MSRNSYIIMPVNVERFIEKAVSMKADAVILDLEDAVAYEDKDDARSVAVSNVRRVAVNKKVYVRINNTVEFRKKDIEGCLCEELTGIVLPKAETGENLEEVINMMDECERKLGLNKKEIILIAETPRGINRLGELLDNDRVTAVMFGCEDYCKELGIKHSKDNLELLYPLSRIINYAKEYKKESIGLYGSVAEIKDLDKFREYVLKAKELGCDNGFCIHPKQLEIINEVYSYTKEEIEEAEKTVKAYEEALRNHKGAIKVDGKMIDVPIYEAAREILRKKGK